LLTQFEIQTLVNNAIAVVRRFGPNPGPALNGSHRLRGSLDQPAGDEGEDTQQKTQDYRHD
jgi:hypothetical protein